MLWVENIPSFSRWKFTYSGVGTDNTIAGVADWGIDDNVSFEEVEFTLEALSLSDSLFKCAGIGTNLGIVAIKGVDGPDGVAVGVGEGETLVPKFSYNGTNLNDVSSNEGNLVKCSSYASGNELSKFIWFLFIYTCLDILYKYLYKILDINKDMYSYKFFI